MKKLLVPGLRFFILRSDVGQLPELLSYFQGGSGPNEQIVFVFTGSSWSYFMCVSIGAWENKHLYMKKYKEEDDA